MKDFRNLCDNELDLNKYPRVVDSYKGIEIWFDPDKNQYYASHCEHTKRNKSINLVKKWIKEYKS
jgi:hypothetical protein